MIEVISSIQSAIEIVGKLRDLSKKIEDAEFKMLLADLSCELADTKLEVANLKNQLAEEIEKNNRLEKIIDQREMDKPELSNGLYKFSGEDGLFCTACFDANDKKIRVAALSSTFGAIAKWRCPVCKSTYA